MISRPPVQPQIHGERMAAGRGSVYTLQSRKVFLHQLSEIKTPETMLLN